MHAWWEFFLFVLIPNFWTALYIMPNVYVVVVFVTLIIYLFEFLHHEICEILKSGKLSFILYFTLNCFTFNLFCINCIFMWTSWQSNTLSACQAPFLQKTNKQKQFIDIPVMLRQGCKSTLCSSNKMPAWQSTGKKISSIFSFPCLLFHIPWVLVTGEEINSYQRVLIGSI